MSKDKHHCESVCPTAGDKVKPIRTARLAHEQTEPSGADGGPRIGSSDAGGGESIESKLSRFDPALHGGEAMVVGPVGREEL